MNTLFRWKDITVATKINSIQLGMRTILTFVLLFTFTVAFADNDTSLVEKNIAKRGFKDGDLVLLIDDVYLIKGNIESFRLPDDAINRYKFLLYYASDDKVTPNTINCATKTTSTASLSGPVLNAVITALCIK